MIELCENECVTIVRKASKIENLTIENYSSEHFGDFLGYLGEYYRLKINARINDTELREFQFFVKSLPIKDLRNRRQMLIETGIFSKEIKVYAQVLSKFLEIDVDGEPWCPTIYLLRDDLIVFEDMTLNGYNVLPFETFNFSQQHVEATIKTLANFHACSIAYEHGKNISVGCEFSDILFETSIMDIPWFVSGLNVIKNIAVNEFKINNSEIFHQKIFNSIEIMENNPYNIPKVLCHRDLLKNNLMFREEDIHCILIDFQTVRYLSLSVDVTMVIICTTNSKHYAKMMDYYLLYYYQQLEMKLKKFSIELTTIMDYQNFLNSCDYHKKVSLIYDAFTVSLCQVPPELFKNFTKKDYNEWAAGDRYSLVKRFMDEDAAFRERMLNAVDAIIKEFHK